MVESFMVALNAVMPFLLLLSVGFLSVRAGLTDRAFMQRLNTLNFRLFSLFSCSITYTAPNRRNCPP